MTVIALVTIYCDGDGCFFATGDGPNARASRKYAKAEGWTRGPGGKDLCPNCNEPPEPTGIGFGYVGGVHSQPPGGGNDG